MHPSLRALLALAALLIAPATAAAAPSITLTTPADGAVYASAPPVLADYACAPDAGTLSPVTQCEGTVANGAAIDTATAGTKAFTVTATDADGATSSVTHTYTVDSTAPAIALTTPAQGAVFASGEVVNAAYACADTGGAGMASCTGTVPDGQPLDTTPGTHTFTVTAIDNAGNSTTVTHSYRASVCTRTGTHAVSCELWARAGTIDLPGLANVPIKTFADHSGAPAITQVGGPVLDALDGDTVSVLLHNDLGEPLALAVPQQPMAPATSKIAPGGYATYSFVARMGTSIYEAGSASSVAALDENVGKQVAEGLYGALVVRPASQTRQAYGTAATAYDEEALMLLSDIDPALNAESRHVRHDDVRADVCADQRPALRRNGERRAADRLRTRPRRAAARRQCRRPLPSDRPARSARERGRRELARPALSALGDRDDGRPGQHGRRARAPSVRSLRGRALRALRHEPPSLQRHAGRLRRNAHHRSTRPARGRPPAPAP